MIRLHFVPSHYYRVVYGRTTIFVWKPWCNQSEGKHYFIWKSHVLWNFCILCSKASWSTSSPMPRAIPFAFPYSSFISVHFDASELPSIHPFFELPNESCFHFLFSFCLSWYLFLFFIMMDKKSWVQIKGICGYSFYYHCIFKDGKFINNLINFVGLSHVMNLACYFTLRVLVFLISSWRNSIHGCENYMRTKC